MNGSGISVAERHISCSEVNQRYLMIRNFASRTSFLA